MNKFAALAIAAAIATTAGLATTSSAQAGGKHFRGHFGIHFYAPYHAPHYYSPAYFGGKVCAFKWKRKWSPSRHRFITYKKKICWFE